MLRGHKIHYRGPITSLLLDDTCRRDSQGLGPTLSSLVILKATGKPADRVFGLAKGAPLHRTGELVLGAGACSRLRTL
ncbi:hypothetical protein E4N62_23780 [Streptomyces sp. MNU76]|uniref:hypothetical protein n=1 Tax=Streptomyces sp. MNU76 TaxID=2560026 RepID=UPI001E5DF793|nr:hypothetical protein [Streptomyces sp. MNU76]MCC9708009.1 hypothetical protein [Streptomyces sp. MNU76]